MTKSESTDQFDTKNSNLPVNGSFNVALNEPEANRNPVFNSLVSGDEDVAGLVAYSIYKQNKLDWLVAFNKAKGREPNDSELTAYIIGESTPRRLATYRHLAHATLEGRGPTPESAGTGTFKQRSYAIATRAVSISAGATNPAKWGLIGGIGLAVIAVIGIYLASRLNIQPPTKP